MSMFKNEKFWLVIAGAVGSAVAKKGGRYAWAIPLH